MKNISMIERHIKKGNNISICGCIQTVIGKYVFGVTLLNSKNTEELFVYAEDISTSKIIKNWYESLTKSRKKKFILN